MNTWTSVQGCLGSLFFAFGFCEPIYPLKLLHLDFELVLRPAIESSRDNRESTGTSRIVRGLHASV